MSPDYNPYKPVAPQPGQSPPMPPSPVGWQQPQPQQPPQQPYAAIPGQPAQNLTYGQPNPGPVQSPSNSGYDYSGYPGYQPPSDPYAGARFNNPQNVQYGIANANQPIPRKKKTIDKRFIIAGGAILLIIIISLIIDNSGKGTTSTPSQTTTEQAADPALADISARPGGELDLSKKINPENTLKPQFLLARIEEQVNLSSGFSFLVKAVGNYDIPDAKPAEGKKFIIVQVVVGNRAEASANDISVSYLDFRLRAADKTMTNGHPLTNQIPSNPLANPTALKSGEQIEGRIVYEVPADSISWAITHSENYRKPSDNTTFDVEGSIAIDIKPPANP